MIIRRNFFLLFFVPFRLAFRLGVFVFTPMLFLLSCFAIIIGSGVPGRLVWFTNDYRVGVIDVERGMLFLYPPSMPLSPDLPVGEIAVTTGQIIRTFSRDLMPAFSRAMPVGNLPMDCYDWSPNGAYHLCESQWNGVSRLWIFDPYGGHQPILMIESAEYTLNGAFSPESDRLAVSFSRASREQAEIYIYTLPDGERTPIGTYTMPEVLLRWDHDLQGEWFDSRSGVWSMFTILHAATPPTVFPIERINDGSHLHWLNENEVLRMTIPTTHRSVQTRTTYRSLQIMFRLEYIRLDPPLRRVIYEGTELGRFRVIGVQFDDEYTILP